jgi:hypothetical protein
MPARTKTAEIQASSAGPCACKIETKGENKASMMAILPDPGYRTNAGLPQPAFG